MSLEQEFAAGLFEGVFGEPAPALIPWTQWAIEVHDNDGSQPLYDFDAVKGSLHLYLHAGQKRAWESQARFVFMIAGKQSGKTVFGPVELFRAIQQLGGGDYLAISATFDLFKLKMLPAIKELFVNVLKIGRYWAGDRILELMNPETGEFGATYSSDHEKMWARVILRSADSEEGMQSASAKWAWLDEPGLYDADVWKDVRGRLSLSRGGVLGTTTPYDLGWLKQQIYDPWAKNETDEIDVIQFSSKLSPFFSEEEYQSLQTSMQSWQFRMDYDAEFERPPAAIYEAFVDDLRENGGHKCKRFMVPKQLPRMTAVDPGIVNPGKLWVAYDAAEDVYYVYRAEKGGERLTSVEHGQRDVKLAKDLEERVIWWAVGAKSEKYWRDDYKKAGAQNVREPDTSDVEEGINRVTQLFKEHRLIIFDDLTDLIDELLRYARVIKNGDVTKEIKDKNTFHLLDALRYFAVQVVKKRTKARTSSGAEHYA
ncbi:MAG: hypothetical protein K8L99_25260 [Anaerolineae bacterium]|nr:hypothetical protein [Anaerolineae bacterium]